MQKVDLTERLACSMITAPSRNGASATKLHMLATTLWHACIGLMHAPCVGLFRLFSLMQRLPDRQMWSGCQCRQLWLRHIYTAELCALVHDRHERHLPAFHNTEMLLSFCSRNVPWRVQRSTKHRLGTDKADVHIGAISQKESPDQASVVSQGCSRQPWTSCCQMDPVLDPDSYQHHP